MTLMKNIEKVKAALDRIETGLATINTDEDWLGFLRFQSLFYHYSFGNAMLIFMQNPEATYVMGYKAWNKLGRYVKKGTKGLAILAPCVRKVESFKEPEDKAEYQKAAAAGGDKFTDGIYVGSDPAELKKANELVKKEIEYEKKFKEEKGKKQ